MTHKRPSVWIDAYRTKVPDSGLGQFSRQFVQALLKNDEQDLNITCFGWHGDELAEPVKIHREGLMDRISGGGKGADLWHSLYQLPSHRPRKGIPWLLTVHDLNFLYEKDENKRRRYQAKLQSDIDRADYLTAISEFTKSDMEKHLTLRGKQIRVIYNGVETLPPQSPDRPTFAGDTPFFFSIGIFNPKKNFHLLPVLMEYFPDHQLIIAGDHSTSYGQQLIDRVAELPWSDRIVLPGRISQEDKARSYAHAEALLFPSFAEGFGMPPIEAMAAGCPVFLSRATSLPEIGGDAAFYFDDAEPQAMVRVIREGLGIVSKEGDSFSKKLRERAAFFSWERAIGEYRALYREILG